MRKIGSKGMLLLSAALMLGGPTAMNAFPGLEDDPDAPPKKKPKEKPLDERQPKVNSLSKEARKVYCKVLKETQCRDTAFKAAIEEENDGLKGENYPAMDGG